MLSYVFTLRMIDAADELRRFDLFDVEAYDEVLAQVNRDLTDGTIPPFEARIVWAESFGRRHRLVSFSSKSFRFGDVAALPIRSPRFVTDEYWYVASAAQLRAAEWRGSSDILRKLHLIRSLNNEPDT